MGYSSTMSTSPQHFAAQAVGGAQGASHGSRQAEQTHQGGHAADSRASLVALLQHPFLQQLKEAIKPMHDAVENTRPMKAMLEKTISPQGYKTVLARLHGFVAPMEEASAMVLRGAGLHTGYLPTTPSRLADIQKDLAFLKATQEDIARLPVCPGLPALHSPAHAFGVCYLLEGSRLGGLLLARSVHQQFGLTPGKGLSYFASGGEDVKALWIRFVRAMTRYVDNGGDGLAIINSAMVSFAQLNGWLKDVKP